jgi:hypothetical protein
LAVAAGAGAVALLPQAAYLLTHPAAHVDTGPLGAWSLAHVFATSVQSPDGTATFAHPMARFYLLDPLIDPSVGFLSAAYLPALLLGFGALVRGRHWPALGLLGSWWLAWGGFLSGIPYQAHRLVIAYLPALALPIGIGTAVACGWLWAILTEGRRAQKPLKIFASLRLCGEKNRLARSAVAAVVLLGLIAGGVQSARAAQAQVATQAAIKADERAVVALVRQAADESTGTPRVVAFGFSAALYHYTGWPVRDLFTTEQADLDRFLAAPGPRLLVIPEQSLATQWAGTPSAARTAAIRTRYRLAPAGSAGPYTVYTLTEGP